MKTYLESGNNKMKILMLLFILAMSGVLATAQSNQQFVSRNDVERNHTFSESNRQSVRPNHQQIRRKKHIRKAKRRHMKSLSRMAKADGQITRNERKFLRREHQRMKTNRLVPRNYRQGLRN